MMAVVVIAHPVLNVRMEKFVAAQLTDPPQKSASLQPPVAVVQAVEWVAVSHIAQAEEHKLVAITTLL